MEPLQYRLLQARDASDSAREEEHIAFADFLDTDIKNVRAFDMLSEEITADKVMDGVDAVLVGGSGAYGVTSQVPWMSHYIDCLGSLAEKRFPIFASCFGFQGIAVALGATVQPDS